MALTNKDENADESAQAQAQPKAEPKRGTKQAQQDAREEAQESAPTKSPLDPYPAYDQMGLDQLRSLAGEKGVGIPADVEKAELIGLLRRNTDGLEPGGEGPHDVAKQGEPSGEVEVADEQGAYPSYDLMTVEELRNVAQQRDLKLPEPFEKAHLIGQLRAAASGPTAAQSAQVGSARPGDSLPAESGVSDKDLGRS